MLYSIESAERTVAFAFSGICLYKTPSFKVEKNTNAVACSANAIISLSKKMRLYAASHGIIYQAEMTTNGILLKRC